MGEGEFLVAMSEVGKNGAVSQDLSCNREVSDGWIVAEQDLIVKFCPTAGISHKAIR